MTRRRVAAALAAASVLMIGFASPAAAHGVGGRRDLPLSLPQFLYAAFFALVISYLLLHLSWGRPRFAAAATGHMLGGIVAFTLGGLTLLLKG